MLRRNSLRLLATSNRDGPEGWLTSRRGASIGRRLMINALDHRRLLGRGS
jgi:hypothetical protein